MDAISHIPLASLVVLLALCISVAIVTGLEVLIVRPAGGYRRR